MWAQSSSELLAAPFETGKEFQSQHVDSLQQKSGTTAASPMTQGDKYRFEIVQLSGATTKLVLVSDPVIPVAR
jgi:hypothetical protein